MVRIANTTMPTAKLPPMTNWPKDSITWPAAAGPWWPCSSTTRVEATFSARRSSVTSSSTLGKIENSSGRLTYTTASSTTSDIAMLTVNSASSTSGESGTMTIASIASTITGVASPLFTAWPMFATEN